MGFINVKDHTTRAIVGFFALISVLMALNNLSLLPFAISLGIFNGIVLLVLAMVIVFEELWGQKIDTPLEAIAALMAVVAVILALVSFSLITLPMQFQNLIGYMQIVMAVFAVWTCVKK